MLAHTPVGLVGNVAEPILVVLALEHVGAEASVLGILSYALQL